MKALLLLAALVAAPSIAPGALAGTIGGVRDGEVRGVSVLPAAGKVEIVIDLQGAAVVQDFTLANPARLVIDLQGTRLTAPVALYDGQNRGGVRNIRYAQFKPDVVRVVIDLDALKDYQIERAPGQIRVRIGTERTTFAAWSSNTVVPSAPSVPPRRVADRAATGDAPLAMTGSDQAAARVTTPTLNRPMSIEEYLAAHRADAAQSQAPRITVQWDNASIEDVIAGFAAFSGRTIILGKDIKGNVTAEIKNQPWDLALNAVLASQGLAVQTLPGGILNVVDQKELARADSTVPITTRLVRINYAKATSLVPSVASILTKRGAVVADSTSNALVITEVSSRIDEVVDFVRGLDLRTPPRFCPSYSAAGAVRRVPMRSITRRAGLASVKSCTCAAPWMSITISTRFVAGSTLTPRTSPSRAPTAVPARARGATGGTANRAATSSRAFMGSPPAWRATTSPAARTRIPAR